MSEAESTMREALVRTGAPSAVLAEVQAAGGKTWTTTELQEDFSVTGFAAPFVVVRRKSDEKLGSLMFTSNPRVYFGWERHQA